MMRSNAQRMKVLVIAGSMSGLLACSHASGSASHEEAKPEPVAAAPAPAPTPAPAAAPAPEPAPVELKAESVFFEFDRAQLQTAGQDLLSNVGAALAKRPDLKVRVEGNCDERGSAAYNLALGEKRAAAAKAYLVQLGAKDDQVSTVSYGKEKPRAKGHDEKAWSENRRADVVPAAGSVSSN